MAGQTNRGVMPVVSDCMAACHTCTGLGSTTMNGRLACNLRDDKGNPAPIDCMIPRIAATVEKAADPSVIGALATTDFINTHIRDTGPFPPNGATTEQKKHAADAAPLVAAVAAQSSGQPEAAVRVVKRATK